MSAHAVKTGTVAKQESLAIGLLLPLLVAGGAAITLANLLAGPLALPLLSMLLLGAGFVVASALFLAGSRIGKGHKTAWMLAGALVFLGFAAALLSDGPEALAQLERMQAHGIASAAKN
jgi:hypothetical protein